MLSQALSLLILIPALLWAAPYGYDMLYKTRSLVLVATIFINSALLKSKAGISTIHICREVSPYMMAAVLMGLAGYCLCSVNSGILWQLFTVVVCIIIYFGILCIKLENRLELIKIVHEVFEKKTKG